MKITEEMILSSQSIEEFSDLVRKFECYDCPLREEAWVRGDHDHPIPNDILDSSPVDFVIIGGNLGPREGENGIPFSNDANQIIRGAIDAVSESLDISINYASLNICMCFPEENRAPHVSEAKACLKYLHKQLSLINPNAILILGSTATRYLLDLSKNIKMKDYINKRFDIKLPNRIDFIPSIIGYHPSYLYRQMSNGLIPRELQEHYVNAIKKVINLSRRYKYDEYNQKK